MLEKKKNCTREDLEKYKAELPVGTKFRLLSMKNDPQPIEPGTIGEVIAEPILFLGDIMVEVKWENRRSLQLIPNMDEYEFI